MGDIRRIVIHIGIILGSSTSHAVLSPALLNTDIPAERMRLRITLRLLRHRKIPLMRSMISHHIFNFMSLV
ncbi:hypothetical protein DTO280E4_9136 [Paecilomyces variotii]|nr:hypothetical protein DTO021C3_8960 [Paecilomyces variotii]KAJ9349135.1 hypothetical protein DTO280E4_9136 [Paecilomyces variotii]